jgi:hypothetical protein
MTVVPVLVFEETLATWVPAKAKKRKRRVPTNSPITATTCPQILRGSDLMDRWSRRATQFAAQLSLCLPGIADSIVTKFLLVR